RPCEPGGVVGGESAVQGDRFLAGGQRVPVAAQLLERDAKADQRQGEPGPVDCQVADGESAVQGDGFLAGGQRVPVAAHLLKLLVEASQRLGKCGTVGGSVGGERAVQGDGKFGD